MVRLVQVLATPLRVLGRPLSQILTRALPSSIVAGAVVWSNSLRSTQYGDRCSSGTRTGRVSSSCYPAPGRKALRTAGAGRSRSLKAYMAACCVCFWTAGPWSNDSLPAATSRAVVHTVITIKGTLVCRLAR